MTMTITNKTRRQLRVVLPPGIIAQGVTGQFGGIGGGGGSAAVVSAAVVGGGVLAAAVLAAAAWVVVVAVAVDARYGWHGRQCWYHPVDDGNDDALPNDYVFLRRSRELGPAKPDDRHDGRMGGGMGGMGGGMGGMGGGMGGWAAVCVPCLLRACRSPT